MKNKKLYGVDIKPDKFGQIICQTVADLRIIDYKKGDDWDDICRNNLIISWMYATNQNLTITLSPEDYCKLSNQALNQKRTLSNMCQYILSEYLMPF